jgi:hypothetical protein
MQCSIYNIIEKLFIDQIYHLAFQIHINKYKNLGWAFYRSKHINTYILLVQFIAYIIFMSICYSYSQCFLGAPWQVCCIMYNL